MNVCSRVSLFSRIVSTGRRVFSGWLLRVGELVRIESSGRRGRSLESELVQSRTYMQAGVFRVGSSDRRVSGLLPSTCRLL
jgi:hypothetical protein